MTERRDTNLDQLARLTATCDQLQAEVDRHDVALALLLGAALGTCILLVMVEIKLRRFVDG